MAQPVKKKIQEKHPDLIKEEPFRTLLVDGNSLLFLSFKDSTMGSDGKHVGGIFQFLLQLRMMLNKGVFDYVYVFFDNEHSGWLRWNLYKEYKANRDKKYNEYGQSEYWKTYNVNFRKMQAAIFSKTKKKVEEDHKETYQEFIDENFDRERDRLLQYFEELYIRWIMDEIVEGDDFIAYYCKNKKENDRIIIMSGDMDLMQLLADDISIYNLHVKKFVTPANFKEYFGYDYHNILVKKILCGDTSDNIGNIKGLSEDGFYKIYPEAKNKPITVEDFKERVKTLNEERIKGKKNPLKLYENILNGVSNKRYNGDFYEINKKLIDLSEPLLTDEAKEEIDSMMYAPIDPDGRSIKNVYEMIKEDGITDLMGDTKFASFFSVFKKLEETEKRRYENLLKK